MPAQPVVTAVIPTYRRPKLLRRAILSALRQTYPHVQVCVYDNASGDETGAIVREIGGRDQRLKYHCHPRNVGSYNNFNYGILKVDTDFFALLSDDDVFMPNFFEKAVEALGRHNNAMFVCMSTMATDLDLNVISAPLAVTTETIYEPGRGLAGMVDGSIPAKWSGILFRREVRDGIGVVDLDAGPYADAGYVFHAAARFPFVVIPGIAAVYMVHGDTTSGTVKPLDGTWPRWWERMVSAIADDPGVPAFVQREIRSIIYPDFRKLAAYQTFRSLGEGRPEAARQSAVGLRDCGHAGVSDLLRLVVWTYNRSRLMQRLMGAVNRHRKAASQRRHRELQARFGHHVEFIRRLDRSAESTRV